MNKENFIFQIANAFHLFGFLYVTFGFLGDLVSSDYSNELFVKVWNATPPTKRDLLAVGVGLIMCGCLLDIIWLIIK